MPYSHMKATLKCKVNKFFRIKGIASEGPGDFFGA